MLSKRVVAQTWPPLGQTTTCDQPPSSLTAILQVPCGTAKEQCQVLLWHSADGSPWNETPFSSAPGASYDLLSSSPESLTPFYFVTTNISFTRSLQFTLKFRLRPELPWTWIRDEHPVDDGHVLVLPPFSAVKHLRDVMPDVHPIWKTAARVSQSPGTQLWSLSTEVLSAMGDQSGFLALPIGKPWSSFSRWFGLVRTSSAWLAPRQGKTKCILDKDAVLLAFMNGKGQSMAILPVYENNVLSLMGHLDDGNRVGVYVRNESEKTEKVTVLVSVGNTFDNAVAAVMYEARTLVEKEEARAEKIDDRQDAFSNTFRLGCEGPWYDGLGFCTWNALGQRLTEQKLLDALDELKQSKIHISNLIIDDNWQTLDTRGRTQFQYSWSNFEADAHAFPNGLKATVSKIKGQHPHIQNVSVWHAIIGYWGGVSLSNSFPDSYSTTTVERREGDTSDMVLNDSITVVAKAHVLKLYLDFYQFLAECGVDGTKVDAQFMLDMFRRAPERRDLTEAYLDAWSIASQRHFGYKTISCMSMIPQTIFHTLLPRSPRPFQLRNSDDYFPNVPSSHPWHVWANAHNAIFTQYLNVIPDWDMFQTKSGFSAFHAAARCVSGGPIYITDVPGQHDLDLIKQITAKTAGGNTIVLRPRGFARSLHSYVGYEDNILLKVGTYHGDWARGTSFLALFNISQRPLTELVHLSSFPGIVGDRSYVIRAHTTGRISSPLRLGGQHTPTSFSTATSQSNAQSVIAASIGVGGFEILSAFPVASFAKSSVQVANFGLVGKMTGGAAIQSTRIELRDNNSISILIELTALGVLGLYISALPSMKIHTQFVVLLNDRMVPEETVSISPNDSRVLEVDVETVWKKMGLQPGDEDKFKVNVICPS